MKQQAIFGEPHPASDHTRRARHVSDEEQRIKAKLELLHDRYSDIEEEISQLHGEQSDIEAQISELEDGLWDLEKLRPEERLPANDGRNDDYRWTCSTCTWSLGYDDDSARFRAQIHTEHHRHIVALVRKGEHPVFDEPLSIMGASA